MPNSNKPNPLKSGTDDAVPSEVQDPIGDIICIGSNVPEQKVILGSRSDAKKVITTEVAEQDDPSNMPKITDSDRIGTPLDLEKALVDLKEAFVGRRVIEVEEIMNDEGNLRKVRIAFHSNVTKISWKGLARLTKGENKLEVHPIKSTDDPKWETVDPDFLELGMVRAILRHRLEKLSKHEQPGI